MTKQPKGRLESYQATLARLGFADPERATDLILELENQIPDLVATLAHVADPDQALIYLARMAEADATVPFRLGADARLADRTFAILGASSALGDHLVRRPRDLDLLVGELMPTQKPLVEIIGQQNGTSDHAVRLSELRLNYRRRLLQIAANDLTGEWGMEATSQAISDLATDALDAGLMIARHEVPRADEVRLAVIAMGKCGARELNYISDIDVIFAAEAVNESLSTEEMLKIASALATGMMHACSDPTSEGSLWEVDAGLRPEGKNGPLVRTLESHFAYYEKWAKAWEFQALLKARPAAGDLDIGQRFVEGLSSKIWGVGDRPGFVEEVQAMRRKVEDHIPAKEAARNLKLGVGGLRDIEFAVQLLQLVHGKSDESLRVQSTLSALRALAAGGYIGREDGSTLGETYSWLRTLEHRIQIQKMRRTHLVPESEQELRRIGRSMQYTTEPAVELTDQWRDRASLVRRIHEKLFYRPLLLAVARLAPEEQRLTPEAAGRRLAALGYIDPIGALKHLQELTSGLSRRAAIQRQLLPAMLGWFAQGPDPDAGLLGFRQLSDALGDTPWYLRTLRDGGSAAQRLALVLSSSRFASEMLLRAPEAAALLEEDADLAPRGVYALTQEALTVARRQTDPTRAIEAVRAVRRRELFRTSVGDLIGTLSVADVGRALTDVTAATLEAALDAAIRDYESQSNTKMPTHISIIAMGRLGGGEMSYPSDADVLFVHEPLPGSLEQDATVAAHAVAGQVRRLCSLPSPEPPLIVDADLRPEGKQGPLVRTLASFSAYYAQWGELWERQALLRAVPIAGDRDLGERFIALIDFYRYSMQGLDNTQVREIRRIKARVESERLPRGADKSRHLKLGPGGLSDAEWVAQLIQLRYGGNETKLRTTSTLEALQRATALQLIPLADAATLSDSWRLATRIRNAIMLVKGRPSDEIPRDPRDLTAVAQVVGFDSGGAMLDEWQRQSRRARAAFERTFFDDSD
ncbi:MAG TPA: bifunctional [glutamine synthetase] adenylyltransferase/[glutamine synthetase]-adenylyl-L-tyrosine phosphorylase [Candidatus Nanopelagicaceae bacterium]|nr:bifunctional [glutamine synthetase] adenylyltransferase/[glutamine synthetase]-adenylyl-L-tyrosine phosphorylase [Candidatus Nanopelagicaceae bacterium]